jgi:anaerobic nitric oxide reductase flavorubredoxin
MNATMIKPDVYWVGAIDWAVRDFHGYMTPNGTTYNNYLIMDEQITLVDTVKHDFSEIMLDNVTQIVHPSKIQNVIINHIENDHATSLDRIMAFAPNATIYISEKGKKGLARFFDTSSWNMKTVKTGDTLNIGKRNLLFLETPMLHWPDSMMTYIQEDKILISQDGFGQHLATSSRFDDQFIECASVSELEDSVIDYYANILMPFGGIIKNKLAEVEKLGIDIQIIAPDHGVIWRNNPGKVLQMYSDMASGKANLSVAVVYDTMWHSTEMMTLPLMRGIMEEGVDCKVLKLRATPMSVAIKEFWKARGLLVGTPTLNNKMFPSMAEFLQHVSGLRPKDRIAGAFGSYGWGGGAVKEAYEWLQAMKLETVEPGVQALYRPAPEDDTKCYEFGREFARRVREYHAKFE